MVGNMQIRTFMCVVLGMVSAPASPCELEVAAGDTLVKITERSGVEPSRYRELLVYNPSIRDEDRLTIGQRLALPPGWPGTEGCVKAASTVTVADAPRRVGLMAADGERHTWVDDTERPPLPMEMPGEDFFVAHRTEAPLEWADIDWFQQVHRYNRMFDDLLRLELIAGDYRWIVGRQIEDSEAELQDLNSALDHKQALLDKQGEIYTECRPYLDLAYLVQHHPRQRRVQAELAELAEHANRIGQHIDAERELWGHPELDGVLNSNVTERFGQWVSLMGVDPSSGPAALEQVDWGLMAAVWTEISWERSEIINRLRSLAEQKHESPIPEAKEGLAELDALLAVAAEDNIRTSLVAITDILDEIALEHVEEFATRVRRRQSTGRFEEHCVGKQVDLTLAVAELEQRKVKLEADLSVLRNRGHAGRPTSAAEIATAYVRLLALAHWVDAPIDNDLWSGLFWRAGVAMSLARMVPTEAEDLPGWATMEAAEDYLITAAWLSQKPLHQQDLPPSVRMHLRMAGELAAVEAKRPMEISLSPHAAIQVDGSPWMQSDLGGVVRVQLYPGPHRFTVDLGDRIESAVFEVPEVPSARSPAVLKLSITEVVEERQPIESVEGVSEMREIVVDFADKVPPRRWFGTVSAEAAYTLGQPSFGVDMAARGLWSFAGVEIGGGVMVPMAPYPIDGRLMRVMTRIRAGVLLSPKIGRTRLLLSLGGFAAPLLGGGPSTAAEVWIPLDPTSDVKLSVRAHAGYDVWTRPDCPSCVPRWVGGGSIGIVF